jgi:hypothetical protein
LVAHGATGVPLISFGVRNPNGEPVELSTVEVTLVDNDSHRAVAALRVVEDANANRQADAGERVLAHLSAVPESGRLEFKFNEPQRFDPGAEIYFLVVADFR